MLADLEGLLRLDVTEEIANLGSKGEREMELGLRPSMAIRTRGRSGHEGQIGTRSPPRYLFVVDFKVAHFHLELEVLIRGLVARNTCGERGSMQPVRLPSPPPPTPLLTALIWSKSVSHSLGISPLSSGGPIIV